MIRPPGLLRTVAWSLHRPLASKGPLIERQTRRHRIDATSINVGTATRGDVLCEVVADVGFRRLQVGPISCGFDALGIDRHGVTDPKAGDTRFASNRRMLDSDRWYSPSPK